MVISPDDGHKVARNM